MASMRDLRRKIRSISNTRKITRTMELVATSKAKRAQDRVRATTPYSEKLTELLANLSAAGTVRHPLLEAPETEAQRIALLVVTGNRGLCGGYNSNVLQLAERAISEERDQGRSVDVYVVGRKGAARFRFLRIETTESYTHFGDQPSFSDVSEVAEILMRRFLEGEVDRVAVASTRYLSAGSQRPELAQILPVLPPPQEERPETKQTVDFIFEPEPDVILSALLPLSVRNLMYRILVEAVASEQLARRAAMKRATDSADEMIGNYRRLYNRTRQGNITRQINEIVSGAKALE